MAHVLRQALVAVAFLCFAASGRAAPMDQPAEPGPSSPAGEAGNPATGSPTVPAMPQIPGQTDQAGTPTDKAAPGETGPSAKPDEAVPVVEYDFSKLPEPVKRLREQIIEAAATGDPEKLRPIIDANDEPPAFSFDETGDPIAYLKSLSGDPEGREILAILIEILDAGYVHVDVGTPDEVYLWPYFARYPVDKLTPRQMVELFKIIYSGDFDDMKAAGEYLFYRVGITPNGQWKFFIAGD